MSEHPILEQPDLERITGRDVLDRHLKALVALDDRLAPVLAASGEVPLRLNQGGFAGMVQIVTSQLLSVASARAIHGRVVEAMGEVSADRFIKMPETVFRSCGLSGAKIASLTAIAEAELSGQLDYGVFARMPADTAIRELTRLKGIGPWTAEIYLLFCTGHPDIFPAGDLALQKSIGHALGLAARPNEKATRDIALMWSPYRGAASRLLWRYFAVEKVREGIDL